MYKHKKEPLNQGILKLLVEATGFEPATSASRTQRSTKLSHASLFCFSCLCVAQLQELLYQSFCTLSIEKIKIFQKNRIFSFFLLRACIFADPKQFWERFFITYQVYSSEIYAYFTVTVTFFVIPLLLTQITAFPFFTPLTTPLLLTVATFVLLLL